MQNRAFSDFGNAGKALFANAELLRRIMGWWQGVQTAPLVMRMHRRI